MLKEVLAILLVGVALGIGGTLVYQEIEFRAYVRQLEDEELPPPTVRVIPMPEKYDPAKDPFPRFSELP